jgi:tRNA threonylcarbamoyl adenosine modification protein YeaZ
MILLAVDYSASRRSLALARKGRVLAETGQSTGSQMGMAALVDDLLGVAAVPRDAISAIAVGLGPGSYTGIRATIAFAQGWELAVGVKITGHPSTRACAVKCLSLGLTGRVAIIIDAQRGEFYLEEVRVSSEGVTPLAPLRLAAQSEVIALANEGVQLAGPDVARFGSRAVVVMPEAAALAELAADGPWLPAGSLEPLYLRPTSFRRAACSTARGSTGA